MLKILQNNFYTLFKWLNFLDIKIEIFINSNIRISICSNREREGDRLLILSRDLQLSKSHSLLDKEYIGEERAKWGLKEATFSFVYTLRRWIGSLSCLQTLHTHIHTYLFTLTIIKASLSIAL